MFNVDLCQQVLGLSDPWKVVDVRLGMRSTAIHVHVQHGEGCRWNCSKCEQQLSSYDHAEEGTWRHLNTCQFQTLVHARIPRVKCPEHGVLQVAVPRAEPHGRFTSLMERFVIEVLQSCQMVKRACQLLGFSWDQAWHVMERVMGRGMARKESLPAARIGIDEKAFAKGHSYLMIASEIDGGSVEFVTEGPEKASLQRFVASQIPAQLDGIKAIAMDMWEPYGQATLEAVPLATEKIVFDRFHILQHRTKVVDTIRKLEYRGLLQHGDGRLKRTKYLWLSSGETGRDSRWPFFEQLQASDHKTDRASAIKENLRDIWAYTTSGWAKRFFERWRNWPVRSRIAPVIAVARLISRKLDNVISYCRQTVTNAVAEGLNSKIPASNRRAGGFRKIENFKTVIYFHRGELRLYP